PGHPEPKHDQSYETEPVGRIHPISSARHPATLPRTGRSGGGYAAPPTAAPDTPVTIIILDDAVRPARAWAGHRRAHRTSETGSSWASSSLDDRCSHRSSCPDSTVRLRTPRFSATAVAALRAAVLGTGHAAFSAYWAIGGTWLLD